MSNVVGVCQTIENKMINCYNEIEIISGGWAGGLACNTGNATTISNCFNIASTEGSATGRLCGIIANNGGTLNINNSYSIGQHHTRYFNGKVYSIVNVGLVCNNDGEINLNKCYYLKTDTINKAVTGMDDEEDKVTALNNESEITAEILNSNIQNIEHTDNWAQWKNTSNGYPILDFSNIENYPKEK